jgi:hypothetical protein
MAQTRGVFSQLYDNIDKTIDAIIRTTLKELPPLWREVFNTQTSSKKFERTMVLAPFGDVPEKGEGNVYSLDLIRPGAVKDFTHLEFGMGFEFTETAEEDDQHDVLVRNAEWLAFSARVVQEKYAANIFNNGFTTETTGDGRPLFDTAHVLAGGGTARNELASAADLSVKSLTDALTDMQTETKIESGQIVAPIKDLILLVPPALEMTAERILSSQGLQGTADNDINALRTRRSWKIQVNPYLTDVDSWFILPQSKRQHGLTSFVRVPITRVPTGTDIYTGNKIAKIRFRQSWGAKWWQGAFGVIGA